MLETQDIDQAICFTEYGKFHYETIAVCATCIIIVGFQNGISSYVFPAAQCELQLTSFELGLLNACFLIGGIVSGLLWGILADINGRKKILVISHLMNGFVTVLCAINSFAAALVICRFLNGFLIGAPGSVIFSYLAEFQPPKYRSACVCCCGLFFVSSWLLLPILSYLILPLNFYIRMGTFFILTPWRLLMIVLAVPEILVGIWFLRMPESPKFYFINGYPQKALMVLRRMYSYNTGKCSESFPIKNLKSGVKMETYRNDRINCRGKTVRVLKKMLSQSKYIFVPPLFKVSVLTSSIMFSNMFGMFGLGLWLPELLIRIEQYQKLHPNSTVTIRELASLNQENDSICQPLFDPVVIRSTVAMAITSLAFNAFSGWLSTKIEIKNICMISMFLGGVSAGSVYWMNSFVRNLVVACLFQATMVTANMLIGSIGVELFPTKLGGVALCLIMCSGRIGAVCSNILFGYLMDTQCEIPIFIVSGVVLVGAILCFMIPKKSSIDENLKIPKFVEKKNVQISVIS